jgi:hypothetical protein
MYKCLSRASLPLYLCRQPLHNSTPFSYIPNPHPHTFLANNHRQSRSRLQHTTMKTLYFLAVIAIATFLGTWAQVIPGGRVCYGVTQGSGSGSITSQSVLTLCDDATDDHWTSLGPVFPISATFQAPPTTTKPSAPESSSSIAQGTEIHSPSWSLTSSTEQISSIKTYYTFTSNSKTQGGPGDWPTSLASSSSPSETLSGAPSASPCEFDPSSFEHCVRCIKYDNSNQTCK